MQAVINRSEMYVFSLFKIASPFGGGAGEWSRSMGEKGQEKVGKGRANEESERIKGKSKVESSVSDPHSFNPDPDTDPDPT
jgi:hypothetical protein